MRTPQSNYVSETIKAIYPSLVPSSAGYPRYRQIIELWSDEDSIRQIRKVYDSVLLKD